MNAEPNVKILVFICYFIYVKTKRCRKGLGGYKYRKLFNAGYWLLVASRYLVDGSCITIVIC